MKSVKSVAEILWQAEKKGFHGRDACPSLILQHFWPLQSCNVFSPEILIVPKGFDVTRVMDQAQLGDGEWSLTRNREDNLAQKQLERNSWTFRSFLGIVISTTYQRLPGFNILLTFFLHIIIYFLYCLCFAIIEWFREPQNNIIIYLNWKRSLKIIKTTY